MCCPSPRAPGCSEVRGPAGGRTAPAGSTPCTGQEPGKQPGQALARGQQSGSSGGRHVSYDVRDRGERPAGRAGAAPTARAPARRLGGGGRGEGWMPDRGQHQKRPAEGSRPGLRAPACMPAHSKAAEARRPCLRSWDQLSLGQGHPLPAGAAPRSVEERFACGPACAPRPPLSEQGSGRARAPARPGLPDEGPARPGPPGPGRLAAGCRGRAPACCRWTVSMTKPVCKLV